MASLYLVGFVLTLGLVVRLRPAYRLFEDSRLTRVLVPLALALLWPLTWFYVVVDAGLEALDG